MLLRRSNCVAQTSDQRNNAYATGRIMRYAKSNEKNIWKTIGNNITKYKTYPRLVGETGGKDFIIAHKSANIDEVVTAIIRG